MGLGGVKVSLTRLTVVLAVGTGSLLASALPGRVARGEVPTPVPTTTSTATSTPTPTPTPTSSPTSTTLPVSNPPTLATPPQIHGTVAVGETVTCVVSYNDATWQGTSWLIDSHRVPGHVSSSYPITADDFGHALSCQAAAHNDAGWTPTTATSPVPIRRGAALRPAGNPFISGGAKVGDRLTVHVGGWTPAAAHIRYQWLRDGHRIPGATGRHYRLRQRDAGTRIEVVVIGTRHGYAPGSATTAAIRVD